MVKITKNTEGVCPFQTTANFIEEIKHIRTHTLERYGITCGIKQAKDLIDGIMSEQENSPLFAIDSLAKDMAKWQVIAAIESLQNELRDSTYGVDSKEGSAVVWYGSDYCEGIRKFEDATLIAAAPDLLAALKNLLRDEKLDDWEQPLVDSRLAAERAVAKAEGR